MSFIDGEGALVGCFEKTGSSGGFCHISASLASSIASNLRKVIKSLARLFAALALTWLIDKCRERCGSNNLVVLGQELSQRCCSTSSRFCLVGSRGRAPACARKFPFVGSLCRR